MNFPAQLTSGLTAVRQETGRSGKELDRILQDRHESHLVEKAQAGDLAAFNELVLAYQESVYRLAYWMLKEEEAAEDATQDTFLRAYRKIHTFRQGKSFRPWLLKIATNLCLDKIRAAQRHRTLPIEPDGPEGDLPETAWIQDLADTPEQAVERAEMESRITRAIHQLTPEYRSVVILVDVQELDYVEASAILDVPLGTMKSRLSRARQQLREALR